MSYKDTTTNPEKIQLIEAGKNDWKDHIEKSDWTIMAASIGFVLLGIANIGTGILAFNFPSKGCDSKILAHMPADFYEGAMKCAIPEIGIAIGIACFVAPYAYKAWKKIAAKNEANRYEAKQKGEKPKVLGKLDIAKQTVLNMCLFKPW
jgi:hypothetical protein